MAFLLLAVVFFVAEHDIWSSRQARTGFETETVQAKISEGSVVRQTVFTLLGLGAICALLRRGPYRLRPRGFLAGMIVFLCAWITLSIVWADDVLMTMKRVIVLWTILLAALAMSRHLCVRTLILWLFVVTSLFALLGLGSELLLGTFQLGAPDYSFGGTLHPNGQGINCALLVLSAIALVPYAIRDRWFFLAAAAVGFALLLLTRTRTALLCCLVALVIYGTLLSSRPLRRAWFLVAALSCGLGGLLAINGGLDWLGQVFLMGRSDSDPTSLTGRIPLWITLLDYVAVRPLQGYGYDAFFTPAHIGELAISENWAPTHAHSAYMQLLLGTGLVGLVSFVTILVAGAVRAWRRLRVTGNSGYAFMAALFAFCLLHGTMEQTLVMASMYGFVVMTMLAHLGFVEPERLV